MKKIIVLMVVAICFIFTAKIVKAEPHLKYKQYFKEDMRGTDLTKAKIKRINRYIFNHEFKANKIYRLRGYDVIFITNRKGREKSWKLLETRKKPVIILSIGRMYNYNGDGQCTDGTYTGYRYTTKRGKRAVMRFPLDTIIKTVEIFPGTNQYTDTVAYRSDTCLDIK
ncbi:MAG: hypothetical protein [Caudoviricetes sp.]|nr:MAG: hypothetical protein [Caudoviricetes sp.]